MIEIQYTLLTDGSSDQALIPILNWLLRQHFPDHDIHYQWADLRLVYDPPRKLAERILLSLDLHPCALLFVHRDAENRPIVDRRAEIEEALENAAAKLDRLPQSVCVIPVRMQEAWLLFDEKAIRWVAKNPNGKMKLDLPRLRDLEDVPNPKQVLSHVLKQASGLTGRHLERFEREMWLGRVADLIDDFSPLRNLPAFQALEADIQLLSF